MNRELEKLRTGRGLLVTCEEHNAQEWLSPTVECPWCVDEGKWNAVAWGDREVDVLDLMTQVEHVNQMELERDEARTMLQAVKAELARFASPVVDGRTLREWRSVGVAAPWEPIIERLEARALAAETVLGRIAWWATSFGEELVPPGADTFGEGVRDSKEKVARLAGWASGGGR